MGEAGHSKNGIQSWEDDGASALAFHWMEHKSVPTPRAAAREAMKMAAL